MLFKKRNVLGTAPEAFKEEARVVARQVADAMLGRVVGYMAIDTTTGPVMRLIGRPEEYTAPKGNAVRVQVPCDSREELEGWLEAQLDRRRSTVLDVVELRVVGGWEIEVETRKKSW